MLKLVVFSPPYNKSLFYQKMGKFFAESFYRRKFPYLINNSKTTWYILIDQKSEVRGFISYEDKKKSVFIGEIYVSEKIDVERYRTFLLNKILFDLKKRNCCLLKTAVRCENEKILYQEKNFYVYKQTKNYSFLMLEREKIEEKN
ncbi:TPA: hypothetical protein ACN1M8_002238 [Enterococcus faecium]